MRRFRSSLAVVCLLAACALGVQGAQADKFARSLEGRFGLPVLRVDERFTTEIADQDLRAAGVHGAARAEARDAVAAQLILQSWLDEKSDALRDLA